MSVQLEPGIKLSIHIPAQPSDDELVVHSAVGRRSRLRLGARGTDPPSAALTALRERVNAFGLTLFNVGCFELGKSPNIHLATPQRDHDIERFKRFIRNLGAAGIHTTTFTWEPDQVWSTEPQTVRGGAVARAVDMDVLNQQGSDPWPGLHPGRDLGELHLLHQRDHPGGRGSRGAAGPASQRSAGGVHRRHSLPDQQLRELQARLCHRRQRQPGHGVLHRLLAGRAATASATCWRPFARSASRARSSSSTSAT